MVERWSMRNKGLPLALLLLGVVVVGLAFFTGTTAVPTYVGSEHCDDCHDDIYSSWQNTWHGQDFTVFDSHGSIINKYTYSGGNDTTGMTGSCAPCHVVGYKDTAKGGFDPTLPWNDTHNLPLLGIGCEDCHGPGGDHPKTTKLLDMSEFAYATSCGGSADAGCHSGSYEYGNETITGWSESAHATEAPEYVTSRGFSSCMDCHLTQAFIARIEGDPLTELPEDPIWKITCMACHDPHPEEGKEHEGQLRVDADVLCEQCHHSTQSFGTTTVRYSQTDLRKATSGYGVVRETWMDDVSCVECHMFTTGRGVTPAKQSHDWTPDPEACMVCHSEWETADEVEAYIEGVQARTEALVTEANAYVADIKALKTWAEANESVPGELWTASLNETYYEALWDITLVTSDGSMGMHNPDYSRQMLEAGIMMAGEIKDALNVGGVSGKIEYSTTPATPIANATIKDGYGNQVAKTGADGSYFFWAPAMNRLYVIELDGKAIGTLSASGQAQQNKTVGTTTIEKAAQSSTNGGGEEDNEEGMLNTLSYGLIAVIVILIVLLVVMAMRKK